MPVEHSRSFPERITVGWARASGAIARDLNFPGSRGLTAITIRDARRHEMMLPSQPFARSRAALASVHDDLFNHSANSFRSSSTARFVTSRSRATAIRSEFIQAPQPIRAIVKNVAIMTTGESVGRRRTRRANRWKMLSGRAIAASPIRKRWRSCARGLGKGYRRGGNQAVPEVSSLRGRTASQTRMQSTCPRRGPGVSHGLAILGRPLKCPCSPKCLTAMWRSALKAAVRGLEHWEWFEIYNISCPPATPSKDSSSGDCNAEGTDTDS